MGKSDLEIAQVDGYMNVVFLLFIGQAWEGPGGDEGAAVPGGLPPGHV